MTGVSWARFKHDACCRCWYFVFTFDSRRKIEWFNARCCGAVCHRNEWSWRMAAVWARGSAVFSFCEAQIIHCIIKIHYFRHFQDSRNIPIFSILLSRPVGTTNIIQTLSITQCFVGQLQRIQGRVAGTVANTLLWFDCSFPAVRHSSAAETQATLLHHNNVMSLYWSMNTDEHIHTWSWTRVELTYLPLKRDIQNMFMLAVIWPVTPRLLQTPTIST